MGDSILRVATHALAVIQLVFCGIGSVDMPILVMLVIPQQIYSGPPSKVESTHPKTAESDHTWQYVILIVGGYVLLTAHAVAAVILLKASVKDANPQKAVKFAERWAIARLFLCPGWTCWIVATCFYTYLIVAVRVAVVVMVFSYAFQFAVVNRYTEWQKKNAMEMEAKSGFSSNAVENEA